MSSVSKTLFGGRNIFQSFKESIQREQKELFFHKGSWEDEAEYFNFIKFLFSNPGQSKISS